MSSTFEVPLRVFGPEAFYRWLYRAWHKKPGLAEESREALHKTHDIFVPEVGSDNSIGQLLTSVEYAKAIHALTEENFTEFINYALENYHLTGTSGAPVPLSYEALAISLPALRQQLSLRYSHQYLWPKQGLYQLLKEAEDAICQAIDSLPSVSININMIHRTRSVRRVHDGLDRCLLCIERFLEVLLEFFIVIASKSNIASDEDREKWLKDIAIYRGKTQSKVGKWAKKQDLLQTIRNKFKDVDSPSNWEHVWNDIYSLLERFRANKPISKGRELLEALRDYRNDVRHAQHTLNRAHHIPDAYKTAIPGIRPVIEKINDEFGPDIPRVAKILSFSQDYTGGVEILLTLETRRMVILKYPHEDDAYKISGIQLYNIRTKMVFSEQEQEFFLYPPPARDEQIVVNSLLLPRAIPIDEQQMIPVKEEFLAAATPPSDIELEKEEVELTSITDKILTEGASSSDEDLEEDFSE